MPNVWGMDDEQLQYVQDVLDDFITNWGKNCTVVYPPKWASCSNCLSSQDAVGGKSLNRWKTGGPIPFSAGSICPLCNGSGGKKVYEATTTVRVLVVFEPGKFFYPVPNLDIRVPFSTCQVKGYLSDWPKLQRMDHVQVETPIAPFVKLNYKLGGEALDVHNVVQGRYFVTTLERVSS